MGECFFWYRPTRVVPDQRPLNGRCCLLLLVYVRSIDSLLSLACGGVMVTAFYLKLKRSQV